MTETSFALLSRDNPNIRFLKKSGCELVIDDFGQGHSSLDRLYTLPFKKLKIDQHFVKNSHRLMLARLVKAIIDIGKTLQMDSIAEGVETARQHEFLIKNGCKYGQGFYYAKPMPIDELINYLKAHKKQNEKVV
jgi:sensor c-di-GMP phosphodiesterase-like protein